MGDNHISIKPIPLSEKHKTFCSEKMLWYHVAGCSLQNKFYSQN